MHDTNRPERFYRVRIAVIPVLLLGAACAMLGWHARQMWLRGRCRQIVELQETATALDWAPDRIRAEIERRFDRERLLAWTSHLSSDVRRSSAWAIGYVGAMGDTETLVAALRHPDPVTASAAADALWRLWLETGQPPEVAAGLRRGRRLVDEGEIDEALRCFNRLIIRWPGVAEPHNQRARIMMIRKDYVGAMEDCYAALASNRYHFDALARLGECYLRLGDAQNAVRCYRQAVSINPNLRSVWRRLAQLREALFAGAGEQLSRT